MYVPKHFEVTKTEELSAFIEANAFGQLISTVEGRLFSSHLPFVLANEGHSLICHVAKTNPQWKDIEEQEVLVTFQGAHGYISPSWFNSPGVPTWNYQAVHVYGTAKLINRPEELKLIVDGLTKHYESSLKKPWEPEYREALLDAIVGIEITVKEIQGKYKLSQNRAESDRRQIVDKLESEGPTLLSEAMKNEI